MFPRIGPIRDVVRLAGAKMCGRSASGRRDGIRETLRRYLTPHKRSIQLAVKPTVTYSIDKRFKQSPILPRSSML